MTIVEDTETRATEPDAENRGAARPAVVRSEPRVYGPNGTASYFQDLALSAVNVPGTEGARDRLHRYALELEVEVRNASPEGRRAARAAREYRRGGNRVETRSGATSSTIAGFTTPEWLISDWVAFRTPSKSFTNQTTQLPLPEYGLQINVPSFGSPTTNAQQLGENQGVIVNVPTGADIPVSLTLIAAQVPISQQLFDRGGNSGPGFDKILFAQLQQNQDAAVDLYVLNQVIAGAYTATWSTSASIASFLADLALAREGLADTAGTRLTATHLFTTSDQFGYWSHQVNGGTNIPFIQPDSSAIVMANQVGDPKWESWTGVHLGPLRWHTDDNIPPSGTNTQLLVGRPQETYTFDGENYTFAYPETNAETLTVQVGLRTYAGAVARFPKSIAVITSTAYPISNV